MNDWYDHKVLRYDEVPHNRFCVGCLFTSIMMTVAGAIFYTIKSTLWGDCEPLTKIEKGIIVTFISALLIVKYKSAI